MRELCSEEGAAKRGWDDAAPPQAAENFHNAISGLGELRNITFPRSIHPDAKGAPSLLVFGDGSRDAYCAIAYARWPMADGTFQSRLVSCKTRVAPRQKISIPRVELMGLLLATRLARKITDSFGIVFSQKIFLRTPPRCLECFIVIPTPFRNLSASGLLKSERIQMSKTGHGFLPMLTQLIWAPEQMWSRLI